METVETGGQHLSHLEPVQAGGDHLLSPLRQSVEMTRRQPSLSQPCLTACLLEGRDVTCLPATTSTDCPPLPGLSLAAATLQRQSRAAAGRRARQPGHTASFTAETASFVYSRREYILQLS